MHHLLLIAGYLVGIVLSFEVPLSVVGGIACPYSGTWYDGVIWLIASFTDSLLHSSLAGWRT